MILPPPVERRNSACGPGHPCFLLLRAEVGDKGLDRFTGGVAKRFRAAEICRISLHEICIEVVLADQKAELVAEPGLAVARAVRGVGPVHRRGNGGRSANWKTHSTLQPNKGRFHKLCGGRD